MFEHERMMKNNFYRKGFEYCFDHYGIILEGIVADENKKLHKTIHKIKNKLINNQQSLKSVKQNLYYYKKTNKDLRKKIKRTNNKIELMNSKWYIKLFRWFN
jgi:septal ring factor EnvC (AmiA/AmiB activator)